MKNIQIIDGAINATYSIFQTTEEEYASLFPGNQDMELVEDLFARLGNDTANLILEQLWQRPICKSDAMGIHGTLFYDNDLRNKYIPQSKREIDWDEAMINEAQRNLFSYYK